MSYLFKAKTNEGYVLKIITEILLLNLKSCCFTLSRRRYLSESNGYTG